VFVQSFKGFSEASDVSSEPPQVNQGSRTTCGVDRQESCDQSGQNAVFYVDVAHPPMPESTKVASPKTFYAIDQAWDNQFVPNIVPSDGEQGDASYDDDNDDGRQKKMVGGHVRGSAGNSKKLSTR